MGLTGDKKQFAYERAEATGMLDVGMICTLEKAAASGTRINWYGKSGSRKSDRRLWPQRVVFQEDGWHQG